MTARPVSPTAAQRVAAQRQLAAMGWPLSRCPRAIIAEAQQHGEDTTAAQAALVKWEEVYGD